MLMKEMFLMMLVLSLAYTLAATSTLRNFHTFTVFVPISVPHVDQCPIHAPFTCTISLVGTGGLRAPS